MTDEQLAALNARLDRIEAVQAETNGRIDTWREALEAVNEALRAAADRLEGLSGKLGETVGKQFGKHLNRLLQPKRR